jgi:hypothetical protein
MTDGVLEVRIPKPAAAEIVSCMCAVLWPGGPDSGGLLRRQELVVDGGHLEVR